MSPQKLCAPTERESHALVARQLALQVRQPLLDLDLGLDLLRTIVKARSTPRAKPKKGLR